MMLPSSSLFQLGTRHHSSNFPFGRRGSCYRDKNINRVHVGKASLPRKGTVASQKVETAKLWKRFTECIPALGSQEVLKRAAVTFGAIMFYRLGFFVPLPAIHSSSIPAFVQSGEEAVFGSKPLVAANIFLLGISPIIAASIVTSLWAVLPWTRELGRKEGREGEASMRLHTRLLAAFFALLMGAQTAFRLLPYASRRTGFIFDATLTMTAGSIILAHLAEEVSVHGLGEGISLLVATSILERLCCSASQVVKLFQQGLIMPGQVALGAVALFLLVYAAIMLAYTEKSYEIVSFKFTSMGSRRRQQTERGKSLPMRVSPSGVSVLLTVSLYLSYLPILVGFWNAELKARLSAWLMSSKVLPFAVSAFSFVLVTVDFTFGRLLQDLASWMQRSSAGIKHNPPLLPGGATKHFLARQQSLAHFWGGLAVAMLGGIAFGLDQLSSRALGVQIGAVSLLLVTGQMTVVYRQVEALTSIPRLGQRLSSERILLDSFASSIKPEVVYGRASK